MPLDVNIHQNGSWIKLDISYVQDIVKRIWHITQESDFGLAVIFAESYADVKTKEDIAFLKKLIQLEASGYIHPPIRLVDMYKEIQKNGG